MKAILLRLFHLLTFSFFREDQETDIDIRYFENLPKRFVIKVPNEITFLQTRSKDKIRRKRKIADKMRMINYKKQ